MHRRFENSYDYKKIGDLQYVRHLSQFLALIFLNGKLIPILSLASTSVIVPYLHVTESPWSTAHGAYESLEYTIARGVFPLLVLGVILLTAITVGRLFCGWACPFGLFQDILSYLPFKKERVNQAKVNQFKDIKWVVLSFSIFSVLVVAWRRSSSVHVEEPIGVFSDSPFSVLSPSATLFAYIPWMMLWNPNVLAVAGLFAWLKFAILIAVIVPSIYIPRFFCRFICPMGAILEPFTKYKLLRIRWDTQITREGLNAVLDDVCPMGVQIPKEGSSQYIDNPNCITCGKCITEEPKILSLRFNEKDL